MHKQIKNLNGLPFPTLYLWRSQLCHSSPVSCYVFFALHWCEMASCDGEVSLQSDPFPRHWTSWVLSSPAFSPWRLSEDWQLWIPPWCWKKLIPRPTTFSSFRCHPGGLERHRPSQSCSTSSDSSLLQEAMCCRTCSNMQHFKMYGWTNWLTPRLNRIWCTHCPHHDV